VRSFVEQVAAEVRNLATVSKAAMGIGPTTGIRIVASKQFLTILSANTPEVLSVAKQKPILML
jgi:hypothetical protein